MVAIPSARLGSLDLHVPRLGFGGAPVGRLTDANEAAAVVEHALDKGIRFLDTAPLYGAGRSEVHIGRVLAGRPRSEFLIATKVGRLVNRYGVDVRFDFTHQGVMQSVEESLSRLQLDSVDLLHIHDPNNHVDIASTEAYRTLDGLRRDGIIKGVGVGAGLNSWQLAEQLMAHGRFDCFLLAGRYTLLHQDALGFIDRCRREGVGVILAGVYNSGVLATGAREDAQYYYRNAPADVLARVRLIETVCEEHTVSLQAAALQFALSHPGVSTAVVGAERIEQTERNIASLSADIPGEFWQALKERGLLDRDAPVGWQL